VQFTDLALGEGDDPDSAEAELLEQRCNIFLIAR
jgi:hypothetical protein